MGFGYLFGVVELLQKAVIICIIATTIPAGDDPDADDAVGSVDHSISSALQLWCLGGVNLALLGMLMFTQPFNERFENVVQSAVIVSQGGFFVSMALNASDIGVSDDHLGELLNMCNLIGIGAYMRVRAVIMMS